MNELVFPAGFLWGAATSAHQVEGNNSNSDWWDWERRPGTPCAAPSGLACDHYNRYRDDIAIMASLGLNTYRFSVEWARIEPADGTFDRGAIDHYRDVLAATHENGLVPIVTLNHFTMPRWFAAEGGWTSRRAPELFERYCRRIVASLEDVPWYCTINEPTALSTGAYLSGWGFPPGRVSVREWRQAMANLVQAHRRAVGVVRELWPAAKVGLAVYSCEQDSNAGGRPAMEYQYRMNEEVYLEAAEADDFIGVQTYTRCRLRLPRMAAPLTRLALAARPLDRLVVPWVMGLKDWSRGPKAPAGIRHTQMGWEYRPESLAEVVRRIGRVYPDKDLVVTEHGVATADDRERVEFIEEGLAALHAVMAEGARVRGYVHWSLMDNFEWATGYNANFGLIGVDRATQERMVRPSARRLGEIARANRLDERPAGR
jgi:beta-glucosidase